MHTGLVRFVDEQNYLKTLFGQTARKPCDKK